jgi:hypothetical protein
MDADSLEILNLSAFGNEFGFTSLKFQLELMPVPFNFVDTLVKTELSFDLFEPVPKADFRWGFFASQLIDIFAMLKQPALHEKLKKGIERVILIVNDNFMSILIKSLEASHKIRNSFE